MKFDALRSIFEMKEADIVSHHSAGKNKKSQVFDSNITVSPKNSKNLGEIEAKISVNSTLNSATLRTSKSPLENNLVFPSDLEASRFTDIKSNRVIRQKNVEIPRVETESAVVRLPNSKSESNLRTDKNTEKTSSNRKKGRKKKEEGSFGSIAPITNYFERKILMKHVNIEGESNPK